MRVIRRDSRRHGRGSPQSNGNSLVKNQAPAFFHLLLVFLWALPAHGVTCEEAAISPEIRWTPSPYPPGSRILRVGPARDLKLPSEAARIARAGDVVEIDAGEYTDTTVWRQDRLWIRGVNGRPHLKSPPLPAEGKAIWVISGDDVTVENVEFSGARLRSGNGAGIRAEGRNLTVRGSYFHDNEMGLLTNHDAESTITIEFSEFAANGAEDEHFHHNIYIGRVGRFVLRFSYSHGAVRGHLLKSRARRSEILYNRLEDDANGTASYELDLPEGGDVLVLGNLIVQSATSGNRTMLSYAAENAQRWENRLTVAYNTFYGWGTGSLFISNRSDRPALVIDNLFGGAVGFTVTGPATVRGNRLAGRSDFADPGSGDYRLAAGVRGIDAAEEAPATTGGSVAPVFEPTAPVKARVRPTLGRPDIGAFEWCPQVSANRRHDFSVKPLAERTSANSPWAPDLRLCTGV
jgi:hypothetical protein